MAMTGNMPATAAGRVVIGDGEDEIPMWPAFSDGLFATFFLFLGTVLFAWLPAQQAADMEPVDALGKK